VHARAFYHVHAHAFCHVRVRVMCMSACRYQDLCAVKGVHGTAHDLLPCTNKRASPSKVNSVSCQTQWQPYLFCTACAVPPHARARTLSPPIRPRFPPPKIAFGRRADGPLSSAPDSHLPQPPATSRPGKTGAVAAAARHLFHPSTPLRGGKGAASHEPYDSRTSTASKLSALLRVHAQHAQRAQHVQVPGRRRQQHTVTPPHNHRHRPKITAQQKSRGTRHRRSADGSNGLRSSGSSSDSAGSSLGTSDSRGVSVSVSSGTADLGDVLSVLASILAEEDGVEAQVCVVGMRV